MAKKQQTAPTIRPQFLANARKRANKLDKARKGGGGKFGSGARGGGGGGNPF